jgi:hypothetical protein
MDRLTHPDLPAVAKHCLENSQQKGPQIDKSSRPSMRTGRLAIIIYLRREKINIGEPANKFAFVQICSGKVI